MSRNKESNNNHVVINLKKKKLKKSYYLSTNFFSSIFDRYRKNIFQVLDFYSISSQVEYVYVHGKRKLLSTFVKSWARIQSGFYEDIQWMQCNGNVLLSITLRYLPLTIYIEARDNGSNNSISWPPYIVLIYT